MYIHTNKCRYRQMNEDEMNWMQMCIWMNKNTVWMKINDEECSWSMKAYECILMHNNAYQFRWMQMNADKFKWKQVNKDYCRIIQINVDKCKWIQVNYVDYNLKPINAGLCMWKNMKLDIFKGMHKNHKIIHVNKDVCKYMQIIAGECRWLQIKMSTNICIYAYDLMKGIYIYI